MICRISRSTRVTRTAPAPTPATVAVTVTVTVTRHRHQLPPTTYASSREFPRLSARCRCHTRVQGLAGLSTTTVLESFVVSNKISPHTRADAPYTRADAPYTRQTPRTLEQTTLDQTTRPDNLDQTTRHSTSNHASSYIPACPAKMAAARPPPTFARSSSSSLTATSFHGAPSAVGSFSATATSTPAGTPPLPPLPPQSQTQPPPQSQTQPQPQSQSQSQLQSQSQTQSQPQIQSQPQLHLQSQLQLHPQLQSQIDHNGPPTIYTVSPAPPQVRPVLILQGRLLRRPRVRNDRQ